jgi:hypothetical protein
MALGLLSSAPLVRLLHMAPVVPLRVGRGVVVRRAASVAAGGRRAAPAAYGFVSIPLPSAYVQGSYLSS